MARNKADVLELPTVPPLPGGEREMIPLSAINQYLFCPRRAALIHVEGIFKDNQHTLRGDIVHEHADLAGYEVVKGVTLLRALPVWSERLGLNGKCDVVEVHAKPVGDEVTRLTSSVHQLSTLNPPSPIVGKSKPPHVGSYDRMVPVEFKLGKRRQWENDDAQLCAQALCLEEMFGVSIPRGAIFHADSKRRREVEFTAELRQRTESAVAALHRMLAEQTVPPAEFKSACEECSLFDICQPKVAGVPGRTDRLARQLFQT